MRVAMHQPHYLPWLGYLDKMDRADLFVLVDHVQFERKNWQNRNYVKSAQGQVMLTVPVIQESRDERIADKIVDERRPWRRKHRRTLEQSYAGAPYWGESGAKLLSLYDRPWKALAELAAASTTMLTDAFEITTPWVRSSTVGPVPGRKTEMIAQLCRAVGATTFLSGDQARSYLDLDLMERYGIEVEWQSFVHPEYRQLHPQVGFLPRMAALDLLLNEGPAGFATVRTARSNAPGYHAEPPYHRTEENDHAHRLARSAGTRDRAASR